MPAGPGTRRLGRLKTRSEFLAVAGARRKWVAPGLIVQVRPWDAPAPPAADHPLIRIGLTASKKVGSAVARNRARRRLRALAREVIPGHVRPGTDIVLIARAGTVTRPYGALRQDLEVGLKRLKVWRERSDGEASGEPAFAAACPSGEEE